MLEYQRKEVTMTKEDYLLILKERLVITEEEEKKLANVPEKINQYSYFQGKAIALSGAISLVEQI